MSARIARRYQIYLLVELWMLKLPPYIAVWSALLKNSAVCWGRARAATRNRVYTGNGCRHTGTVAVPAELGECAHPARPQAAEDPSDARAKTAVHGRIRVI